MLACVAKFRHARMATGSHIVSLLIRNCPLVSVTPQPQICVRAAFLGQLSKGGDPPQEGVLAWCMLWASKLRLELRA